MLVRAEDVRPAVWCLHTFFRAAGVDWPVVFHQGGRMDDRDWRFLESKFPESRVLRSTEADGLVEPLLQQRGMANAVAVRRRSPTFHKLVDPILLSRARTLLMLDTDILFFRRPAELLDIVCDPGHLNTFNRDAISHPYNVSDADSLTRFGRPLPEWLNSGLSLLNREAIDLDRVESYCAESSVTTNVHFIEQTILALLAAEFGHVLLPETYVCSKSPGLATADGRPLVAKHYIETPRPLLFEEGMVELIRQGALGTEAGGVA